MVGTERYDVENIDEIIKEYLEGNLTQEKIAEKYNITRGCFQYQFRKQKKSDKPKRIIKKPIIKQQQMKMLNTPTDNMPVNINSTIEPKLNPVKEPTSKRTYTRKHPEHEMYKHVVSIDPVEKQKIQNIPNNCTFIDMNKLKKPNGRFF